MGKYEPEQSSHLKQVLTGNADAAGHDPAMLSRMALKTAMVSAGTHLRKEQFSQSLSAVTTPSLPIDWARKEIECARVLNFELPENLTQAVEQLEAAVQNVTMTRQAVILVLDEESGIYTCLNDEKTPGKKPRELTWLSDRFLQELLGTEEVIHTYLLLNKNLVGIVAIADKCDESAFNTQDELVLDLLAPYLATKVSAFKTLKQSLSLPYIQGQVLGMAGRLITAVDQDSIFKEALSAFAKQLQFDVCQYVSLTEKQTVDKQGKTQSELYGEVLYEKQNAQVASYTHAGLQSKRKKIRDFAGLVALLTSIARKDPYLQLNGRMLGDKSLSDIFGVKGIESALILPVFNITTGQILGTFNLFNTQASRLLSNEQLAIAKEAALLVSQALSRAQVLEKALAMASTDELTGLTNRRGFYERFEAEVERTRRKHSPLSVALIDVDHFKHFNDTYGHLSGDLILKALAELFVQNVRKSDMVCRFGGEEFAILLPDTDLKAATELLERVRRKVEKLTVCGINGETLKVTISAGVRQIDATELKKSDAPASRDMISQALAEADELLYTAKGEGRNKICS